MVDDPDRPAPLSPGDYLLPDDGDEPMRIEMCTSCKTLIKVRLQEADDVDLLICVECANKKKRRK